VIQFIHLRLKRSGSDFKYIAVKELQDRGAIHYHVLCIYSKPYIFPSTDDVASSWRLGYVKISAPKIRLKLQSILKYIGKYIGKGYEYEELVSKKSFSESQIKQIYKLSPERLHEVIKMFGKERAESFACTYRKVYLVGFEIAEILGKIVSKPFRDLIMDFPSEWEYQGIYDSPF
jgi:hypothetical protein